MIYRTKSVLSIAWLALAAPMMTSATEQLARSSDKEVRSTIESLAKLEKNFERSLDSKFKKSVLRSSTGEVAIGLFLQDFSAMISELQKRISTNYAASSEVKSVLTQASVVNTYMLQNPSTKGADEWDAVAAALNQLAASYFTTFPVPEGAVVRRIGDGELTDAATQFGKFAGDFAGVLKKQAGKIAELKEGISAASGDLKSIQQFCKEIASRVRSGKPASAVARQLFDSCEAIDQLVRNPAMPAAVGPAWAEGATFLRKIEMSFGIGITENPTS